MSDRSTCRDCANASKVGKDKKPVRPGTVYCDAHRKGVANNYVCGQYKKR